jgi:hypothetical protein
MFGRLLGLVRADVNRQVGWVRAEIGRQARYTALTAGFALMAALAGAGAIVVGFIALYTWIEMHQGPLVALAVVGGILGLLALILFALAFARRRPRPVPSPPLQSTQPSMLAATLKQDTHGDAMAAAEHAMAVATDTLRHGSRQQLFGALALAAVAGLILGRRL